MKDRGIHATGGLALVLEGFLWRLPVRREGSSEARQPSMTDAKAAASTASTASADLAVVLDFLFAAERRIGSMV